MKGSHYNCLQSDAHGHVEQNTVLRNDLLLLQEELDQQQRLIQALLQRKVTLNAITILIQGVAN